MTDSQVQEEKEQVEHEDLEAVTVEQEAAENQDQAKPEQETEVTFSIEEWQQKLAESEQKVEENYQKFLRAQADLENFRRRARKEKEDQAKYAALPLVEQLLPVLDNFERALKAGQETQDLDSLTQGVDMVFRQLTQVLSAEGLSEISAVGAPFDPHVHQAVMQVQSAEHESGAVVEELQKGFMFKDRVIRPAMVKVNE